jgi:uncharacterized protein (TIGR02996 family)
MTEDAFLQAILENEDDDAPRLVYADWLEENGASERAAFIRCQCLRARLPSGDARRRELRVRCRELLKRHVRQWVGPLRPWLRGGRFHRGLLDAVTVPAQVYLDHAAEIVRLVPIRRVTVDLADFRPGVDVVELVPESVARGNFAMPIGMRGRRLVIAVQNLEDQDLFQMITFILNRDLEPVRAAREQIVSAINAHYTVDADENRAAEEWLAEVSADLIDLDDYAGDENNPAANLVNAVLREAVARGATEVQLAPVGGAFWISYRVDGQLAVAITPPLRFLGPMVRFLAATARGGAGRIRVARRENGYRMNVTKADTTEGPRAEVTISPWPRP